MRTSGVYLYVSELDVVPTPSSLSSKDRVLWVFKNMTNNKPFFKLCKLELIYGVFSVAGKHDVAAQPVLFSVLQLMYSNLDKASRQALQFNC